jgi:hypothetical protein
MSAVRENTRTSSVWTIPKTSIVSKRGIVTTSITTCNDPTSSNLLLRCSGKERPGRAAQRIRPTYANLHWIRRLRALNNHHLEKKTP